MIIKGVRLHPFSGIPDRRIEFEKGLNVVLGPNEAGKSTVFHAVQTVLFTPARIGKKLFETGIKRFLPAGGGDTVRVTVEIVENKNSYVLERSWGAKAGSELRLPDGMIVTDDEKIQSTLLPLLHANEGTYRSVLMVYQTGLRRTLDELKTDYRQTVFTLGDILRKAVLQTDGVSIDRFREALQKTYDGYYNHWDERLSQPEQGRGITNPWQTKVGHILRAFYEKEELKGEYERAVEYERRIDGINKIITEKEEEIARKKIFLEENEPLYEAAKEQKTLIDIEAKMNRLSEANSRWPVAEDGIRKAAEALSGLEDKKKKLEKEREEYGREVANRALRERYLAVVKRKSSLEKETQNLMDIEQIDRKTLDLLQRLVNEKENLLGRISAGRLSVSLTAKREFTLLVQKGLKPAEKLKVDAEKPVSFDAGGRIRIESPDMEMEIVSGEASDRALLEKLKKTEEDIEGLLKKHKIDSFEDAVRINSEYEAQLDRVQQEKVLLENALNGDSFEKLTEEMEEVGEVKQTREEDIIIGDLLEVEKKITQEDGKRQALQDELKQYEKDYGTQQKLLLEVARAVKEHEDLTRKLKNLPALPGEIADPMEFVADYEKLKTELGDMSNEINTLHLKRAEIEKDEPETASEEYATGLASAEERYEQTKKKAEAFLRIKLLSEELVTKLDSATYRGIEDKLEGYIETMTDGRYGKVAMNESVPEGFVTQGGVFLPHDLLSAGTRDTLALALRLSMAEYFLEESDGFLLMDDPLVNMDPSRQKKAAEVLARFAEKRQLILFSCHPSHADLLGGTLVSL
ncbi:MAG: AAA family ATPase [Spirochaetes bacterium]|nr:AAA family ATPase [Spirochaetota bacterium]